MTDGGIALVKVAMMLLPLVLIVGSYLVHRRFFHLDAERYEQIVAELRERDATATGESTGDEMPETEGADS